MKSQGKKPNILIVITDQQRADMRKSNGFPLDTMPFLDGWAKGGADFENAYTSCPSCLPARVCMLTGRYINATHAKTNEDAGQAHYAEDLVHILKREGYTTGLFGKNHTHLNREDFDTVFFNGEKYEELTGAEKEFDRFNKNLHHMESHVPSPGGVEVLHITRSIDNFLHFLETKKDSQPFFSILSFVEPHNPYFVPEPYFDMFPPESLPSLRSSKEDLPLKGKRYVWLRKMWERVMGDEVEERIARTRSNYLGMLRLIDDQMKRLMSYLDTSGIADDTVILYISDHGDYAGEYGLIRKGVDLPEALTRIPMIWRGPGIKAQGKIKGICSNIVDVMPTILDIAGVRMPVGVQGKSLLPILREEDYDKREFEVGYSESGYGGLYWNEEDHLDYVDEQALGCVCTFNELNSWTQSGQVRMVRKGEFKLQLDMLGNGYLYNLKMDPAEVNNLWDDKTYEPIKSDLLCELGKKMMQACDVLPLPMARYRLKQHPKGYVYDQKYISEDTRKNDAETSSL